MLVALLPLMAFLSTIVFSCTPMISKVGKTHFGSPDKTALVSVGNRSDANTGSNGSATKKTVRVGSKSYDIYPWGKNNKKPHEMMDLLGSNADLINLLDAKKDFLFGAGIGVFEEIIEGKTIILAPVEIDRYPKLKDFLDKNDISEYNESAGSHVVDAANLFVNVSIDADRIPLLTNIDPLLCRTDRTLVKGMVSRFLISPDWASNTVKDVIDTPALLNGQDLTKQGEYIFHVKRTQTGQFFYSYATWWAVEKAVRLANRLWDFHINGLDTEYNASNIVRVAGDYFRRFGSEYEGGEEAFRNEFWENVDSLLSGEQGSNRMLADECDMGPNGLIPYIEVVPIERGIKGDEYLQLYESTILSLSNASGILSNISGVSNGKVMGGSGSELRVSAEFQQQYRTPRERQMILRVLNRKIKPLLQLPNNVVFAYKNIILQTLDKNPTGSQKTTSNAS